MCVQSSEALAFSFVHAFTIDSHNSSAAATSTWGARTCCKDTYVDGLWSAPSAEKYGRKVVVTQVVIARQAEVTRACGAYQAG